MAKTKLYMDEHGFSYEAMADRKAEPDFNGAFNSDED